MSLLLRNGTVLTDGVLRAHTDVHIEEGVIARIGSGLDVRSTEEIDVSGRIVAPGFVDLHIHGAAGVMCESADPEAVATLSELLPGYGVSSFLPTLAALPVEALRAAVTAITTVRDREPGARILGIHLEGPFLNPQMAGAQRQDWMRRPDSTELEELQAIAAGSIRLLTVAPELPGAIELITTARRLGITVALGHSAATATQMREAITAGATHVTHLFNAMRPLHHREPGPVGVALTDDDISVELICDGHHVAPTAVELAWRCKPHDKVVLVTDAVALGIPDGHCSLFGVDCMVAAGAIHLAHTEILAGSCLSLDQALRNLQTWLPHEPLPALLACASANPAAVIGDSSVGQLAVGAIADVVVLDTNLTVLTTLCDGRRL